MTVKRRRIERAVNLGPHETLRHTR